MVDGHSVLQRVRPPRIGGKVATDRAGPLARRIWSVVVSRPLQMLSQVDVDQSGFDDGVTITQVDFQNSLHPRQ